MINNILINKFSIGHITKKALQSGHDGHMC